ncbi:unnamed protein product [Fraxinus pennsylvanica]|uniref:Uncharacterized protein n=1 Tax=Fraxinus pennsylvanica TaxID=56036 RepID=A0AAD1YTY4_9LAMI|nr:unnamed protein product [Fraxinus pennsylvanica]
MDLDEVEIERKIDEIQTMARKARVREKRELKNNGFDKKSDKKLPVSSVGILRTADGRKIGVEKDKLHEKEGNGALMFKKKYKFKGLANILDEKPKGFTNPEYESINKFEQKGNMEKGSDLLRNGNDNNDKGDSKGSDLMHLEKKQSAPSNKLLNGNYSLNGKEVGNTQGANNNEDTKSESEPDFWWLNLPYVLVPTTLRIPNRKARLISGG